MARLEGVDLPNNKRAEIALTYIYGIGPTRARSLLYRAGIPFEKSDPKLTRLVDAGYARRAGDGAEEVDRNIGQYVDEIGIHGSDSKRGSPERPAALNFRSHCSKT